MNDGIEISCDPARLDVSLIHRFLRDESHWGKGIALDVVERSIAHSVCLGAYRSNEQVGFARAVTDHATFAYLCDVFVVAEWRGRGIASRLVAAMVEHPALRSIRRIALRTRDAAPLYAVHGFTPLPDPQLWMERRHNDVVESASHVAAQELLP